MKIHSLSFLFVAAGLALLSGCEKSNVADKSPTVAKVAGEAITQAELDLALARVGQLNEAQRAEARGKLLQALIDQRLVAAAARQAGVDKDPAVAFAVDQAARQVLAEAYAERLTKDLPRPTEGEIAEYYAQHPELFAQRRIYRIQELELKVEPSQFPAVEAKLRESHSMGDFVNWVKEQGIEGKTAMAVRPAEQIPAPLLARLAEMRDGQVTAQPGRPGHLLVQQLIESQLQPVSLEQAKEAIERALVAQKRKERVDAEVKKLREAAKIEYASGFAPASEAPAAGANKAADKPAQE